MRVKYIIELKIIYPLSASKMIKDKITNNNKLTSLFLSALKKKSIKMVKSGGKKRYIVVKLSYATKSKR